MSPPEVVSRGMVVRVRYVLRGEGDEVLERSPDEGEEYLHGAGQVPPGLERALEGKARGDRMTVTLRPQEGYGSRRGNVAPQPIPRATFPAGAELKAGMSFSAETPDGQPATLYIVRVDRSQVFVDANHPYAGRTLEYDIEILAIREPTAAEKRASSSGQ
jgi:FKBP-type peptidyl-prolyl cis-trans isomerase SlyD